MPEQKIDYSAVAIATNTFYPKWYRGKLKSIKHTDKIRGDLSLELLQQAVARGCRVICVDGNSNKTYKAALQEVPGLVLIKRKSAGRGESKRRGLKEASKIPGVKAIVLTEPEKVSLITDCLDELVRPILFDGVAVVVPQRNEKRFKQFYPSYMYQSEIEGNNIYNQALRTNGIIKENMPDLDFFFGPRVLSNEKKIVSVFMRRYHFIGKSPLSTLYDPDSYSNVLFFSVINALKRKMNVQSVEVPFVYPQLQKENENSGPKDVFILKRNMQRVSILIDLMHFLSLLGQKRTSRLRSVK